MFFCNTLKKASTNDMQGGFSDYWKGTPDGRLNGPYCPREKWADVLKPSNGFSGLDIVLDDYTNGHVLTSVILATAIDPVPSNGWHQDPALTVVSLTYGYFRTRY